jgi:hypothetical protein
MKILTFFYGNCKDARWQVPHFLLALVAVIFGW